MAKPKARRLQRATADRAFAAFMDRVAQVNAADAPYALRVETIVVFGSYATEAAMVGDVDIGVDFESKFPRDSVEQEALEEERRAARNREFRDFVHRLLWSTLEVLLFLKARSPVLSLHQLDELPRLDLTAYKVVLGRWPPPQRPS